MVTFSYLDPKKQQFVYKKILQIWVRPTPTLGFPCRVNSYCLSKQSYAFIVAFAAIKRISQDAFAEIELRFPLSPIKTIRVACQSASFQTIFTTGCGVCQHSAGVSRGSTQSLRVVWVFSASRRVGTPRTSWGHKANSHRAVSLQRFAFRHHFATWWQRKRVASSRAWRPF